MRSPNIAAFIIPLTIVALAIPLILEKVPRNRFYGFRTPFTMSSNEIWYYSNKVSGVAMLFAGLFWFLLGRILPAVMQNTRDALALAMVLGAASIMAALAISYVMARRKFPAVNRVGLGCPPELQSRQAHSKKEPSR